MALLSDRERTFLEAVSKLAYANPFLPERIELEKAALGSDYVEGDPVWSLPVNDPESPRANAWRVTKRAEKLAEELRARLMRGDESSDEERVLYEDLAIYTLYQGHYSRFLEATLGRRRDNHDRWSFYPEFRKAWFYYFRDPNVYFPTQHDLLHTFACFRQIQVAFEQILRDIIGGSLPAARLRASVWQSIFTHDMRRYRRTMYARMGEFATLITGPSGTGKEVAARAIARSRYTPFDEFGFKFAGEGHDALFHPINVSALSPTLVESELFGHKRGSFTGAFANRVGWLAACSSLGSVFLDELGDLDPAIQVKLLRVIETRTFHAVGDTATSQFKGKIIAATNRDLAAAMRKGAFREDLYFRLCSDQIVTPSLAEQIAETPTVLRELIVYMTRRVAGAEGEELAGEVADWIEKHLDPKYAWPGNYRELEQCVKNVLIRRDYRPAAGAGGFADPVEQFVDDVRHGKLQADEVLSKYATLVYAETGQYDETARRIGLDRRTVKSKIDWEMLGRVRSGQRTGDGGQ